MKRDCCNIQLAISWLHHEYFSLPSTFAHGKHYSKDALQSDAFLYREAKEPGVLSWAKGARARALVKKRKVFLQKRNRK